MKKLTLKNGISFYVTLTTDKDGRGNPVNYIAVYDDIECKVLLYSVKDGGFNNSDVIFGDNVTELACYHILSASEIIDNFKWYWNNLNQ